MARVGWNRLLGPGEDIVRWRHDIVCVVLDYMVEMAVGTLNG
jgi:hypothetical protein